MWRGRMHCCALVLPWGPGEKLQLDVFEGGGTPLRSYIGPQSMARVLVSLLRSPGPLPVALNIAAPHPAPWARWRRRRRCRWS
jgi:hypothetical protein